MAHADFELLSSKVQTARQLLVEARQQLIEHTTKHGSKCRHEESSV